MIPAQIEKEVLIEAPIDVVWRVVTEPDQIKQWFCSGIELDPRAGGAGRMVFDEGESFYLQVEAFEPPHRFAYRWLHDEDTRPRPDNSMLVEFTLHPEAGSTRLRVVESGFDTIDWSDEAKAKYASDHSGGWHMYLERLRAYAPRANSGARE